MAEVLVFCSKTLQTDAFGAVGVEDISLRHPRTHSVGWMNWRIMFPVDLAAMKAKKRAVAEAERREWDLIRFQSGVISRSMLLRDMSVA